jgi:hypothetical protein
MSREGPPRPTLTPFLLRFSDALRSLSAAQRQPGRSAARPRVETRETKVDRETTDDD